MDLLEFQNEVGAWSRRNFPGNSPYTPLLGAMEELGELAHAHLKGEQGIRHSPEEIKELKKDAVADVIVYLADYCSRNAIDIDAAVTSTWNEVKTRDWLANPMNAAEVARGKAQFD